MTSGGRRKAPTAEDRALWESIAKDVAPLKRRPKPAAATTKASQPSSEPASGPAIRPVAPKPLLRPADPPRLAPLDRRTRARIGKGTVAIDARIDLHGLTQASAHQRLRRFLDESQATGAKLVLVITGKGRRDERQPIGEERGVIRRSVPGWLASPELRPYVIGYEEAGRVHGGEGALYVRIRSRRRAGP